MVPSAIVVIPPIEWPTSTSGPSGATAEITEARSSPSWAIEYDEGSPRPDRPWPRWSHTTTRCPAHRR